MYHQPPPSTIFYIMLMSALMAIGVPIELELVREIEVQSRPVATVDLCIT